MPSEGSPRRATERRRRQRGTGGTGSGRFVYRLLLLRKLLSVTQNPAPQLFPPSARDSRRSLGKCTLSEDRRRLGKGREWLPGPTCRLGGGQTARPKPWATWLDQGMRELPRACPERRGAVTWSPGTPAPGDRVRDQEECLDEGAGSQESVPARWSYSCELSEAPPASPGLQIGEPAPGGLASERTRGRARARARAPRDRAGGGEAAAASQRNGSEASDQL